MDFSVCQVSQFKTPQTEEDDFIEIQSETGTAFQRFMVRQMTLVKQVWCKSGLNQGFTHPDYKTPAVIFFT